jgi:hypothetical protein
MANVDIRVGKKNAAFFSANPTLILKNGQFIFNETTSELFIGDGVTQLSSLVAINGGGGGGSGFVPYTGATQDTDLGTFSLNAKSLHVKGTAGSGHLGLKHQSANITANASESSFGANSSGNPVWKNDGNAIRAIQLDDSANTATNYTTPLDADKIGIWDVVNSILKSVTWSNIKSTLKNYFDTVYTTSSAVATQISTAISGKEDVSNKQNSLTVDGSGTKYTTVDAVNAALAALNVVNLTREEFTYTSGAQTFTLTQTASACYAVFVMGQELNQSQYTVVGTTLTILDTLGTNDKVNIIYSNASLGINPAYTKLEVDALLAQLDSNALLYAMSF